jgi:hypothetical protein
MQDVYFQISKNMSDRLFPIVEKTRGNRCDVFKPIIQHSIYGDEDSLNTYPDKPDIKDRRYIVFNLLQAMKSGGETDFDNLFQGESPYALTLIKDMLPKNTKLVIYLGDHKFIFKVDTNSDAIPGWNGALFVKNMLEPFV